MLRARAGPSGLRWQQERGGSYDDHHVAQAPDGHPCTSACAHRRSIATSARAAPTATAPVQAPVEVGSRWALALAIVGGALLLVVVLSLLGSREADNEAGRPGGPVATVAPPVSEAVLAGSYDVKLVTTSAKGWESLETGDRATDTWSFSPNGTRLNGEMMGGSWVIVLERTAANAHGSAKAQLSECQFTPVTDSLRVRMQVEAGHFVGDRWVARRFEGTFHMYSPPATSGLWSCPGSALTARLVGTQR